MAVTRQAIWFTGPFSVEVRAETLPTPQAGQVLVRTVISAISSGTEKLLYRGEWPPDLPVDETIPALAGRFSYPLRYGYAVVGQVVAAGEGVAKAWLGRLVFSFQPHVSFFVADLADVWPVPDGMSAETAVFLPYMETAVSFLMDGQPMIGEQVAVLGQGVIGLLTTALLTQFPLATLVTLDQYPVRRQWSKKLGATISLDPMEIKTAEQVRAILQTGDSYAGADLVYELSGNPAALDMAIEITGYNGRIVVGSWYGRHPVTLHLGGRFHREHIQLISSQVSHIAPQWNGRWNKHRRLQVAWQMLTHIQPEQFITHRFSLHDAAQAYQSLVQAPQETLQIIFEYQTE